MVTIRHGSTTGDQAWPTAAAPPRLAPGVVHVWRISLAQPTPVVDRLLVALSPDERARAERAATSAAHAHFVVGRGALRDVLSTYVDAAPHALQLAYGPRGKPTLAGADLHFNAAHSHGLALVAVALDREVGVDLERVRPLSTADAIAGRFFTPRERAALTRLSPGRRLGAFLRLWTRKEAYLKATGSGLGWGRALATIDVDRDLADGRWSVRALDPGRRYVAALVAEGSSWSVAAWQWRPPGDAPSGP